ncbi:MAG: FAD-binding oxidoreductase [Candidatus Bathyarchaeota archaeon]|jgi:glycine/D-amino acid oxidase-like deaminating enzyme
MHCDILVIGAGVLGLSSALHLKRLNPGKGVLVVDRLGGPGQGNTAKSAGIYLTLFTTELNYFLGDSTADWFHHLQEDRGHPLKMTQYGYLYLLDRERYAKLREPLRAARSLGVEVETYSGEELGQMIPDLVTDFGEEERELMGLEPVEAGILGVKCGSIDTDRLAKALEAEFLRLGGEVEYNTEVSRLTVEPERGLGLPGEPFIWQDLRVSGADTDKGEIRAGTTVLAAGVWSERLLATLGFDPLMRPKKRVIYVFKDPRLNRFRDTRGFSGHGLLPFTQIPEISAYFKVEPAEGSIWLGCAEDLGRGYGLEDDPQPERRLYTDDLYHALVRYLPCFKDLRPVNAWAGQRAVNRYDKTPVVAPIPGMIYVGSATGYGITKCDALGRTVAAVYAGEDEVELYGGRRIRAGDLGVEDRRVEKESFKV